MRTAMSRLRRFLVALSIAGGLIAANPVGAADTFDGQYLTIPQVSVGSTIYTNVVITVGSVVGVDGGTPVLAFDSYDSATGVLTIPSVEVLGDTYVNGTYTNVSITVGSVVSVGGQIDSRGYPVVDTHSHVDGGATLAAGVAAALVVLPRNGITHAILMSPPSAIVSTDRDGQNMLSAIDGHEGKLFASTGGSLLNGIIQTTSAESVTDSVRESFLAQANSLAAMPIVGFGEIALRHLSLAMSGPTHPYEDTAGDHPLLLALADLAAQKGIPIDVHCDVSPQDMGLPTYSITFFNPATPTLLTENLAAFERLIAHNPAAKIVWAHAGSDPLRTRDPDLERALLTLHPNLYMSLRVGAGNASPGDIFSPQAVIKPTWLALLQEFPDRFVFGSDYFHTGTASSTNSAQSEERLQRIGHLLDQLPDDLARKIAYQNAVALFGLQLQ